MAFDVRPEDLEGFGRQVDRAAQDVQQAREYVDKHAGMGLFTDQGLILWMTGLHTQAGDSVRAVLTRLDRLLTASARELDRSAAYYRATDAEQASRLDSTYPSSKR
jgi:hypothetical protein